MDFGYVSSEDAPEFSAFCGERKNQTGYISENPGLAFVALEEAEEEGMID